MCDELQPRYVSEGGWGNFYTFLPHLSCHINSSSMLRPLSSAAYLTFRSAFTVNEGKYFDGALVRGVRVIGSCQNLGERVG